MKQILLLIAMMVSSNFASAKDFNHNARIPNANISFKHVYGVYHGKTLNMAENFSWQIRVKKIEGRTGLIYYRDSLGDRCHGRYSVRAFPRDGLIKNIEVLITAENAICQTRDGRIQMQIGLSITGERPMDGKRGPRMVKGLVRHGMAFIPSKIYKAIVSHP